MAKRHVVLSVLLHLVCLSYLAALSAAPRLTGEYGYDHPLFGATFTVLADFVIAHYLLTCLFVAFLCVNLPALAVCPFCRSRKGSSLVGPYLCANWVVVLGVYMLLPELPALRCAGPAIRALLRPLLCFVSVLVVYRALRWLLQRRTGACARTAMTGFERVAKLAALVLAFLAGVSVVTSACSYLWENRPPRLNEGARRASAGRDVNVVLIVIDALRADHLGCYGHDRDTSPMLDAFAREHVLFKNCYAPTSWTLPSVASLFTARYPSIHRTVIHGQRLPETAVTLAEILRRAGYLTYGFVTNPNLKTVFNLDQGFALYDDSLMRDKLYYVMLRSALASEPSFRPFVGRKFLFSDRDNVELANARILPRLARLADQRFFMYLHYMDPHEPYSPPPPYDRMFDGGTNRPGAVEHKMALYDGEIRYVDHHIGQFLAALRERKLYEKTLIVITSDHGEAFGEHETHAHGFDVHQEEIHVPLLVKLPGPQEPGFAKEIVRNVTLLDVLPTILDVLGLPANRAFDGISALPLIRAPDAKAFDRDIFIDHWFRYYDHRDTIRFQGVIDEQNWKYTVGMGQVELAERSGVRELLFNLTDDPGEEQDRAADDKATVTRSREKIRAFEAYCARHALPATSVALDRETLEQLRSLGYLK